MQVGKYYAVIFLDVEISVVRICINDDGDFQNICECKPTRRGSGLENAQHIAQLLNEYEKANAKPYVDKNQLELELNGVTHND